MFDVQVFGFRIRKSMGISVPKTMWSINLARVKDSHPYAIKLNGRLNQFENKITELIYDYKIKGIKPTKTEFENAAFGYSKKVSMHELINDYLITRRGKYDFFHVKSIVDSIISQFPNIKQIDTNVMEAIRKDFENKGLTPPTIKSYMTKANKMLRDLNLPVPAIKQVKYPRAEHVPLFLDEVKKIIECQILDVKLDAIRDNFVFQCLTGMRYSDVLNFKRDWIITVNDVEVIRYYDQKTKSLCSVPLFPEVKSILNKYKYVLRFPLKTTALIGNIRKVCKLAGVDQKVTLKKYKGANVEMVTLPKYYFISTHSARRTFVTVMMELGIPDSDLRKMTGHSKQASFDLYDKSRSEINAAKYAGILKGLI